jgi:hypothetical protein
MVGTARNALTLKIGVTLSTLINQLPLKAFPLKQEVNVSPDEQRIAIAEACGWFYQSQKVRGWYHKWDLKRISKLPDYYNSLDAMHEAEKVLTDEQWHKYRDELRTTVLGPVRMVSEWCKADIHATASQKAKCFLKAICKYKE